MLKEDVQESLNNLKDKRRFFRIDGEKKVWFYDANIQGLYSVNKDYLQQIENDDLQNIKNFSKLQIEDFAQFVNFFAAVHNNNIDTVPQNPIDTKCNIMINTSNRCNLKCTYCYCNKENPSIISLKSMKDTIKYAMTRYKPDASEFVISYSMTSESSVDLPLLKQIAAEYINYEDYQFVKDDILEDFFDDFYRNLKGKLFSKIKSEIEFPQKEISSVVDFLNSLLDFRNLYDILEVTDRMFNNDARGQIQKRDFCSKWKLYRINRWCLEVIFDKFIKKRHVPYVTFWFMSNGTCASDEFIDFIKACDINPFWISIDGLKSIHDKNRKFNNGTGSYDEIIKNLIKFRNNGIELKASVVLTTDFPKPLEIIKHIQILGFKEVSMTPIRPGYENSFDEKSILDLCKGYDEIFEVLEDMCLRNDFSLFRYLKEDLTLSAFNVFLERTKIVKRCSFDNQIIVNSKGEIYPCLYFTDKKDFYLGNIREGLDFTKLDHNITIDKRELCNDCWARYLCGGTCFYASYISKKNYKKIDTVECILKKHLAERCLKLIVFMHEHNINIHNIY